MSRKLATVRLAGQINPIPGADVIVATAVGGWFCVTQKGEFNEGDKGVYFEIDSFLPASDSRFAFLAKNFIIFEEIEGARLRTMKLKGQVSQGLFLPMNLFPELADAQVGDDVTEILGITKWEPAIPAQLAGEVVGPMPSCVKRTDEERIQNLTDQISSEIAGHTFEVTVKLDGTSMTVFNKDGYLGVAGRNWELRETEGNSLWKVARKINLIDALQKLGRNLALQGELIGEGIQGNNEKLKGQQYFLFNIWDIDAQSYVSPDERQAIVSQLTELGASIKQVPILEDVTFPENVTVQDILNMADGASLYAENREGLVFKRKDGKFSFKAISNWYLLKHADR